MRRSIAGTLDGKHPHGWFPEQRITVEEAIEAYTLRQRLCGFQERTAARIRAGKLADLVVLVRDILDKRERDQIGETKVQMTVVGGKVVFEPK